MFRVFDCGVCVVLEKDLLEFIPKTKRHGDYLKASGWTNKRLGCEGSIRRMLSIKADFRTRFAEQLNVVTPC